MRRMWPQPMLAVRDVASSRRFYEQVLGAVAGHGGDEYEQVLVDGELLLQLHELDVGHHHGLIADPGRPLGNGVLLWFEVADFESAVARIREAAPTLVHDVHTNPNAGQQEIWFHDPDGYTVVVAGPSVHRPREG